MMQGGLQPRPRHPLVRGGLRRHQGALPAGPPALALAARGRPHRPAERSDRRGDAARVCGRRDSTRCPAAAPRCSSTACARPSARTRSRPTTWLDVMRVAHGLGMRDDGDDDVRLARHAGRARRAPAPHPRPAGRDRRLHGLHPLDLPGRQHGPRGGPRAGHRRADYLRLLGREPPLPRQRAQRAGLVGHAGAQGRAGRARLRRQRHGLDDDRGERRQGGGREPHHHAWTRWCGSSAPPASCRCSATRSTARCAGSTDADRPGPRPSATRLRKKRPWSCTDAGRRRSEPATG